MKTAEQNLIVCTGKSEAEVTSNKRLRSRYRTVKLTTDSYEASCSLFAVAELLVSGGCDRVIISEQRRYDI